MKVGSLFSGIGGFDLGFERAGFDIAWQVEIDEACRGVLGRQFGGAAASEQPVQQQRRGDGGRDVGGSLLLFPDVREVGAANLEPVDVVVGGFPCQDISVAGRRAGLDGSRSGLWWEFHRILAELTPRWCVIENVPGLLSSNGGRDMGAILGALGDLGYGWAYRVLDAQFFGLAQRRRRVFIVGCLGDGAAAAEVLLEPEGCRGDSPTRSQARAIATGEIARSLGNISGGNDIGANKGTLVTSPVLSARRGIPSSDEVAGGQLVASTLRAADGHHGHSPPRGDGCDNLVAATLSGGSSPNSAIPGRHHEDDENVVREEASVRRLIPLECERLQGFPDGWTEGQADTVRSRQLGNAVAVPVVEWIANRIAGVHRRRTDA